MSGEVEVIFWIGKVDVMVCARRKSSRFAPRLSLKMLFIMALNSGLDKIDGRIPLLFVIDRIRDYPQTNF